MAKNEYRVSESADGWFEPQMQTSISNGNLVWVPLNAEGYWVEGDTFNFGIVAERHLFKHRERAEQVILRARTINEEHIAEVET